MVRFCRPILTAGRSSGDPDYFYDFYVPLSAFPGVTADTPLRMSGITITSAQSGLTGTVSDVGGVDFAAYSHDPFKAWTDVINSFPPTTLNQLQSGEFSRITAMAPVVTGPIAAGSTTIVGTSVEAAGSTIIVYRNGSTTPIGTTTVNANGSWSITVANTLLIAGDKITATVTPTNKAVSAPSNEVTITAAAVCIATPAPTLTGQSNGNPKYAVGTTPYIGRQKITLYAVTVINGIHTYDFEGSYIFTTATANAALLTSTTGMTAVTGTVTLVKNSNYVVTTTPVDANGAAVSCESVKSNQLCIQNGGTGPVNSYTASIANVTGSTGLAYSTLSEIPTGINAINGTLSSYVSGISIILLKNTVQTTFRVIPTSTSWSINTSGLALAPGDVLDVRVEASLSCGVSLSAASNFATIKETTAAPVMNAIATCGFVKTVSGTSAEPGSVVTIFTNGTTTSLTGVVASTGVWAVDVSSLNSSAGIAAGVPITARAKTAGKATSVFSNSVTSSPATPVPSGSTFTINGVQEPLPEEQLVTIRGTGPPSTATTTYKISLSIGGTLFPPVTTTASGTWEISGISPLEVYTGAVISATFSSSGSSCPSAPVTTTVQCRPPGSTFTTTLSSSSICYNTAVSVVLSGSEKGVSYRLTNNGTPTGASVLGTGGSITLVSGPLTASTTTLSVRAADVGSDCATTGIGGNKSVTMAAAPVQPTSLASSVTSGCSRVTTNITLNGPTSGYRYQL